MNREQKELEIELDKDSEKDPEKELEELEEERREKSSVNIPISGSPLYPRIFIGDSAKPLQGQFPESEYVDDNIHRTWQGLMSFYG